MTAPTAERTQPASEQAVPMVFADTESDGLRTPWAQRGRTAYEYALHLHGTSRWLEGFIDLRDLPWDPEDPELDRTGLNVGRFFERHPQINTDAPGVVYRQSEMAILLYDFFRDADIHSGSSAGHKPQLMGINSSYEADDFSALLCRYDLSDGETYPWHHAPGCARVYAGGALRIPPPWTTATTAVALGINPDAFALHTARGDVELAEAIYEAALRLRT